jgi:hypothetical protein
MDDEADLSRDLTRWPIIKPTRQERKGFEAEERDDKERERLRAAGTWGQWPRKRDTDEPPTAKDPT